MAIVWWEILLFCLAFLAGYLVIFVAADKLIDNLCDTAKLCRISPFLIGLLIIGIDPEECIASIIAATQNLAHIAIGNIIGNTIIALTLCFAIPLLFLSKSNLNALCNLKNAENDNTNNTTKQETNDTEPIVHKQIELMKSNTDNTNNDKESSSDSSDSSNDNNNASNNPRKEDIKRFKKANRNLIPIFYYILLISSVIVIALNSAMSNYKYNLLITGSINLFLFVIYILKNIHKYFADKSMDIVIDPESESSSSSSSSSSSDKKGNTNDKNTKTKKKNGFIRILRCKCIPIKTRKILFSIFWLLMVIGGGELLVWSSEELIERIPWVNESIFGYLIISFVTNIEEITLIVKSVKKNQFHIGLGGMIGKMFFNLNLSYGICGFILLYIEWRLLDIINSLILVGVMIYLCIILYCFHFKRFHGIVLMLIFVGFYIVNIYINETDIYE